MCIYIYISMHINAYIDTTGLWFTTLLQLPEMGSPLCPARLPGRSASSGFGLGGCHAVQHGVPWM